MSDVPDYEREEYSAQGFVNEYLDRRISAEGMMWWQRPDRAYEPQPAHNALYEVCRIFEERNAQELSMLVRILLNGDDHTQFTYNRYVEVVDTMHKNQDEGTVQMPYGRLVALMAFAGQVSLKLIRNNCPQAVTDIAVYTGRYLERAIRQQWPIANRSWTGFVQMSRVIIQRHIVNRERERVAEKRRQLLFGATALCAALGVGIYAWKFFT
ncbi:hypothetical protein QR680_011861 [Steinernema hermaphroditum]|uniref:Bcl-2 Bcl-2 homology region 1-3 domain-containing protein n=1 Tax=Steinernema hermaphroditum TaxID=289476 RepID=A0AA39I2B3_9BILA|nr:hypothetical protein QR680_011861 [Steinernema hermaphroditum]